ncbi:hypothetical protein [Thomasclavelia cocleata]|jgi:hypothetical protein|uniref:hypothetical protein n=1 Tax=Thomasclavelia cocleata TaxID=69824 RepID=UPI00255A79ED|nr:hypothetical protein [Thomasclavelia cocleata]
MVELKLNYDELTEMSLEGAKKIVGEFDNESFLEDIGEEVNGANYGVKVIDEGDWIDEGKYQYRTDIGVLCEFDDKWNVVKMFDIAVTSEITRSGSYFSEYNYEYDKLVVNKIIKKVIPKQIIPERTVVTLG